MLSTMRAQFQCIHTLHIIILRLIWIFIYHGDHAARPDAIGHSHHAHVVSVLALSHEILVSHIVRAIVNNEAAAFNPAGLAPAQEGSQFWAVVAGLILTTLEVPVLVENDLKGENLNFTQHTAELKSNLPMVV